MKRIILSTLVALTVFGGVAAADRRPDLRDHRGGVSVTPSRGRHDQRPQYTVNRGRYEARTPVRYVRRPIYVQRPRIAVRYYNYYQRPTLLVENYPAVAGYYWVAGQWSWTGYEWTWTPGHYEPDPNYDIGY